MAKIAIRQIGVTKADVDAVVNAANEDLRAGGGVCGAIFEEAGRRSMQAACDAIGHCDTGDAVITPGFSLRARHVIHAVGPVWHGGDRGEAGLLASCYARSIDLAVENGCKSIAFPLISSGIYGYPKEEAWRVAIGACHDKLGQLGEEAPEVTFCVVSDSSRELGEKALSEMEYENEELECVRAEMAEREVKYLDACQGCLIGGAVGDALGYAVEFISRESILHRYGPAGITEFDLDARSGLALVSDDTQMTLFTGMGYLVGLTRYSLRGIGGPEDHIRMAYLNWLDTQDKPYDEHVEGPWLVHVRELYSRRAPGNTCLSALRKGGHGTVEDPVNNSKGCGGVMRVAPLGLAQELTSPMETAANAAAMTHGHPFGYMPAAALAYIVNRCMRKARGIEDPTAFLRGVVLDCAHELPSWFPEKLADWAVELGGILEHAVELAAGQADDASCISELGGGWVGEEALAVAAFCAMRHAGSFDDAVIAAVNHDGDSDSTGAICGNIMGALLGLKSISPKWTEQLELRDVIMELAKDLCDGCRMEEFGSYRDETWLSKYGTPNSIAINDHLRETARRNSL